MKLMIASDIHGSARYCGQMLEAYRREQADRLLILGDILYHGPRNDLPEGYDPKEVIAMLNPMKEHLLCVWRTTVSLNCRGKALQWQGIRSSGERIQGRQMEVWEQSVYLPLTDTYIIRSIFPRLRTAIFC